MAVTGEVTAGSHAGHCFRRCSLGTSGCLSFRIPARANGRGGFMRVFWGAAALTLVTAIGAAQDSGDPRALRAEADPRLAPRLDRRGAALLQAQILFSARGDQRNALYADQSGDTTKAARPKLRRRGAARASFDHVPRSYRRTGILRHWTSVARRELGRASLPTIFDSSAIVLERPCWLERGRVEL
jgi:hypothetical protein